MSERKRFIEEWMKGSGSCSELCEAYGISRKTAYKWWTRFEEMGLEGLSEKSRAHHGYPHTVPQEMVQLLVEARRLHPKWGPRKLLGWLHNKEPSLALPVASTVSVLFKRLGLARKKRRKVERPQEYTSSLGNYYGPNAVWCADFKGALQLRKTVCNPLTISDGFSRYLIRLEALGRYTVHQVKPIFESAFREYGMPDAMRTDNGPPFATVGLAGLSALSVWWIKLGIRPERIRPGKPTENGRHERIHRTMVDELELKVATTLWEQQLEFFRFQQEYNTERPHEALANKTPHSVYAPSPRHYPVRIRDLEYANDYLVERADENGMLRFQGQRVRLTPALTNELVGLKPVEHRTWQLFFGPVQLGTLSPKGFRAFKPARTPTSRTPNGQGDAIASTVDRQKSRLPTALPPPLSNTATDKNLDPELQNLETQL